MSVFPTLPLCPVCAGHHYKKSKLYPNNRYCVEHGILMTRFNFLKVRELFCAVADLRQFADYCDLFSLSPVFAPSLNVAMDMKEIARNVVQTFDEFRGAYYAE